MAQGSGFFVTPDLIATNLHVLKYASDATVKTLDDGISYSVSSVAAFDLKHDLCVLRLAGATGLPLQLSREEAAVGDEILVAGNPEGLEASFSKGMVSALRPSSGLIQMDAPISPGSSGGPVLNLRGAVLGVTVSSYVEGQNLNFAVPVKFLGEEKLTQSFSVGLIGGLAISDREYDGLSGSVKEMTESHAQFIYDKASQQYVRQPALTFSEEKFNRDGQLTEEFRFKHGVENGRILWEYSDVGLRSKIIDVYASGERKTNAYQSETAMEIAAARHEFDEVEKFGSGDNDPNLRLCTYDSEGLLVEWSLPNKQIRYVSKYDDKKREIEGSEYRLGKLYAVTHSKYENNERGDWVVRTDTLWLAAYPEAGFTPGEEDVREISYY